MSTVRRQGSLSIFQRSQRSRRVLMVSRGGWVDEGLCVVITLGRVMER